MVKGYVLWLFLVRRFYKPILQQVARSGSRFRRPIITHVLHGRQCIQIVLYKRMICSPNNRSQTIGIHSQEILLRHLPNAEKYFTSKINL